MRVDFRHDLAALHRKASDLLRKELPFAVAVALTATAKDVRGNEARRVERVLDRPTPFTKRGVYVRPATKRRLHSVVGYKRRQAEYLRLQAEGGTRRPAAGRRALVVPGGAARLNRYGNLPRGGVRRLLDRSDTFSGRVNGVAGIWQRYGRGRRVRLLVAYEGQARYRARLGFDAAAIRTAQARFPIQLARQAARVLR